MTEKLTGRLPRTTPSPLEHLYEDAATAPMPPPGHPAAPRGPVWTRPPDKPAAGAPVDAAGRPVT